ncbi:MAG: amino acid permease [Desulfovibrio sp.]|nr:amino acid permease [Desulfovibrio sp.]
MNGSDAAADRPVLKKYMTPLDAWAVAFGVIIGWGCFVMPGTTFVPLAGPAGAAAALALSALVMLVIGANYSYLMSRRRGLGGVYAYAKEAFGTDQAFLCTWFLILSYISILFLNVTALFVISRLILRGLLLSTPSYVLAGTPVYLGEVALSVATLLVTGIVIMIHNPAMQRLQTVMAVVLLAGVAVLGCMCLPHLGLEAAMQGGTAEGGTLLGMLAILAFSPWAFIGFDVACLDTAYFKFSPHKSRRVVTLAILAGGFAYVVMTLVSITAVPDRFLGWEDYFEALPRLGGIVSLPTFNGPLRHWGNTGLLVAAVTAFAAIMTCVVGCYRATTRILAAMAEDRILSKRFLNTSFCLAFVMGIAVVICFTGMNALDWFVELVALGAIVGFGCTSAAAWRMARRNSCRRIMITGACGVALSALFLAVQLVPRLSFFRTMKPEAYMTLAIWCLLGFLFYLRTMLRARPQEGRGGGIASAALFSVMLYSLVMWYALNLLDIRDADIAHPAIVRMSVWFVALAGLGFALMLYVQRGYRRLHAKLERAKIHAEESSRAKSEFLFNMSHDVRTPLNAIMGFAQLASQEPATPPKVREYISKISVSGSHMLALVDSMLEMGQIESGNLHLHCEPGDIGETVRNAAAMMEGQMEAKQINFKVQINAENCACVFDSQRLLRVLIRLLGNAAKFTPEHGSVLLSLTQRDRIGDGKRRYKIEVSDSGIGMSKEFASKVFTAFSRERSSTESGLEGTGLGLAIAKSLVDAMGGTIGVKTEPGKGSVFTLRLEFPAANRHMEPSPDAGSPFAGKHLLLVDDIAINREIAQVLLEDLGFAVDCAENGRQAVDMVEQSGGKYSCVIMDVQMPVMNGYEATRAIRALPDRRLASIPVTALSANALDEDVKQALAAGMNAHIAKPLDVAVLSRTLAKLIEGRQAA